MKWTFPSGPGGMALVAALCFAAGGATVYLLRDAAAPHRPAETAPAPPDAAPAAATATASAEPLPDLVVPIAPDLAKRAGIQVTPVGRGQVSTTLRAPGTVMPDQYRQVQVSPVVGGQVTRVSAELGDRVRRGVPLAQIFSSELADAQSRYLSARAALVAADERLQRTTRLVSIGAASQQELEQTQAERTKLATDVEGEAARLRLIGMTPAAIARLKTAAAISGTLTLAAPADGVITERTANVGAVVTPAVPLFVISSISPVWVIADIAEGDLQRIRVGTPATVHVEGAPPVSGKVAYISPEVRTETRTAQVRVETPNPGGQLRFGMLVTVELTDAGRTAALTVPEGAVQSIGGRSFVYLTDPDRPGEFIEREVATGARAGGAVEILSGLAPGDTVVSAGSFFIRAERERLGLRPPPAAQTSTSTAGSPRVVDVAVTEAGFVPARVEVAAGSHVQLRIVRQVENTCATEVVVPSLNIRRPLPLKEAVLVDLGRVEAGDLTFACGMDMLKAVLAVR